MHHLPGTVVTYVLALPHARRKNSGVYVKVEILPKWPKSCAQRTTTPRETKDVASERFRPCIVFVTRKLSRKMNSSFA